MSSLRNAVKRKTHKERPTPRDRTKFGLLERKKDYRARAEDFHRKDKALQSLQRKATERNPDEFYFAMEKARTQSGVHVRSSAEANRYTQEQLCLFKGQDIGYLLAKKQSETKKVERLRASLLCTSTAAAEASTSGRQHMVFVEDEEDAAAFCAEDFFDTPADLLGRSFNRPRHAQLHRPDALLAMAGAPGTAKRTERRQAAAYTELKQREQRREKLGGMLESMTLEKAVMGKGRKRKLKGEPGNLPAYRWKQERKQ